MFSKGDEMSRRRYCGSLTFERLRRMNDMWCYFMSFQLPSEINQSFKVALQINSIHLDSADLMVAYKLGVYLKYFLDHGANSTIFLYYSIFLSALKLNLPVLNITFRFEIS